MSAIKEVKTTAMTKGNLPVPQDAGKTEKSKAELRKERREKQEAQRAAKSQKKQPGGAGEGKVEKKKEPSGPGVKDVPPRVPDTHMLDDITTRKRLEKRLEKQNMKRTEVQKRVDLFSHLQQYEREMSLTQRFDLSDDTIPPVVIALGLQYAEGIISGSNARCVALISMLLKLIAAYKTPEQKELARDLDSRLKPCITFLNQCRPQSVSMGNAIKYLKFHLTKISAGESEDKAKYYLRTKLKSFVEENIILAGRAIADRVAAKIADNDVIMVYGCSSLLTRVLKETHEMNRSFHVIVVDSYPRREGREMLRRLVQSNISCSYILINYVPSVMKKVSKVLLGAHAILTNGHLMSRIGSSQLALIAQSFNVPVIVCCETYKFSERVQTDSFVFNELADPDDLIPYPTSPLNDWRDHSKLSLVNLAYDVTPANLVTMVITDMGQLPCSSVPVVLRVKDLNNPAG